MLDFRFQLIFKRFAALTQALRDSRRPVSRSGVGRNKGTEVPAVADQAEATNCSSAEQPRFAIAATLRQHNRRQKFIAGTSLRLFRPTTLKEPGRPFMPP